MNHRLVAGLALCLTLLACETAQSGSDGPARSTQAAPPTARCNPVSGRQADRIEAITRAIANRPGPEQLPTAQERADLERLAAEMANVPEGLDAQGGIYCAFQSARAANLALRTPEPGDSPLIDRLAGAADAVSSACSANPGEPSALHCRQLGLYAALGRSRATGHPLILAARGPADAVDPSNAADGFVAFGESALLWRDAAARMTAESATPEEQEGARREMVLLACQVRGAGLVLQRPSFGLSEEARRSIALATLQGEANVATGLGLGVSAQGEAFCAADPAGLDCLQRRQEPLIGLCVGG